MKFHEMHYFKQQRQSEGWKGDFFVFEKKKFFDNCYAINKLDIPDDFKLGSKYLRDKLSDYIIERNTQKIFQTKFMDIETENNISYELSERDKIRGAKISKTTLIENKFERFLKNKKDNLNPKLLKYSTFSKKEENLMDVISYFALQCSRTPLNLYAWFYLFINKFPFENTKNYALEFRNFYNKEYLKFFSMKYQHLINNKNNILIVPFKINSINPNLKGLISVSEDNTINLLQYKNLSPFLKSYPDDLLNNIDITVVSNDLLYFCIINKEKAMRSFYDDLLIEVQKNWNTFSLFLSYEYLICSKQEEALNFISEKLFCFHKNNEIEEQYKINNHIEKLLLLEKHLR